MGYFIKFEDQNIAYIWGSPAYAQEMLDHYINKFENEDLYLEAA